MIVSWFFSHCFLHSLSFCIIISYNTLLPIDNEQAVAVDIGIAMKSIPVRLNVLELDVMAILTNVSNDFNFVVEVLYFLYFFYNCCFCL